VDFKDVENHPFRFFGEEMGCSAVSEELKQLLLLQRRKSLAE